MKCILCEQELKSKGNTKAICRDCVEHIANKAIAAGADFESYSDAVIVSSCPDFLTFSEYSK